jgi:hypothetical protein
MKRSDAFASPAPGRPKAGEIPSGDRPAYSAGEGQSSARGERRAAPKPARIPSGDRPAYSAGEGQS